MIIMMLYVIAGKFSVFICVNFKFGDMLNLRACAYSTIVHDVINGRVISAELLCDRPLVLYAAGTCTLYICILYIYICV